MTADAYSIHHYAGSWVDGKMRVDWRNLTITREIVNVLIHLKRLCSPG